MTPLLRLTIAAIVLRTLSVSAAEPVVFDVKKDFSTITNPNGPWSYGWFETLGSSFQLFTEESVDPTSPWSGEDFYAILTWHAWLSPEGHPLPGVFYNASNSIVDRCEPGCLFLHPALG